jgi:hypothetical protein
VISSTTLGTIALVSGCAGFNLGFVILAGDAIQCKNTLGVTGFCIISGVLTEKFGFPETRE